MRCHELVSSDLKRNQLALYPSSGSLRTDFFGPELQELDLVARKSLKREGIKVAISFWPFSAGYGSQLLRFRIYIYIILPNFGMFIHQLLAHSYRSSF